MAENATHTQPPTHKQSRTKAPATQHTPTQCGLLIKQIDSMLSKRANAELKQHGVTVSQVATLNAINSQPNKQASFKQIERTLRVSQPTTAGLLARLREKGLVETFISETNANAKIACLTTKGEALCNQTAKSMANEEEYMLAEFSPEERKIFYRMLVRIAENLSVNT